MTPDKIDAIFAERRKKQDEINKKIDLALASNNNAAVKLYLDELLDAFHEPIKFD